MITKVALMLAKEPVRIYLYGVFGSLDTAAVVYGVLTGEEAAVWLAVAGAVLAVPAVEKARSRVRPVWNPNGGSGGDIE